MYVGIKYYTVTVCRNNVSYHNYYYNFYEVITINVIDTSNYVLFLLHDSFIMLNKTLNMTSHI